MDNISICYLSWKRHNIFEQTLESHKLKGLFDIIEPKNRIIFFQELSQEDINIANKYSCSYIGDNKNIGILNAFIKLVEKCETEYLIFSENDWQLIEDKNVTYNILQDCVNILKDDIGNVIRLRHRKNPGNPLYSRPLDVNVWLKNNISGFPYKLESLTWLDEPNKVYNNIFTEYNGNYKWYITSLNHQRWSNNIFIAKTEYLKNTILPLIKNFSNNNDKYLGLEEILINHNNYLGKNIELDNLIKKYDSIKLVAGEGLFTHKDYI